MKKILISGLLMSTLPFSLLSYEVNFNKTFSKKLLPDTLNSDIKVRIELDSEKEVSNKLDRYNDYIKNVKYIEKNLGVFNIRPRYRYVSKTPKIDGYLGEIKYSIKSNDPKKVSRFINGLINLKEHRDTSIIVSNLMWKVKESSSNVAVDLLRFEAITWAEKYAKNLSSDLKRECKVKI